MLHLGNPYLISLYLVGRDRPRSIVLPCLFVLVALLNGAPFLLSRIGVLDHHIYRLDRQAFCLDYSSALQLVSACPAYRLDPVNPHRFIRLDYQRLHHSSNALRILKVPKALLFLALPFFAGFISGHLPLPALHRLLPVLPLLISFAVATIISLQGTPLPILLASLLPWLWLIPLVSSGVLASKCYLEDWSFGALWLLLLQLPILIVEAVNGLPMPFGLASMETHGLPGRLVGSFTQPNSLGIAAVALMAFAWAYLPTPHSLCRILSFSVLPPVFLARSGTGLVVLLLLSLFRLRRTYGAVLLVGASLGMLALPQLLGRSDLWSSLDGRFNSLWTTLAPATPLQWLFGRGIASNSNQILSLFGPGVALHSQPTDGMPGLLLQQGGLLALCSFYGLILWGWRSDSSSQPFLLVAFIGSLTINLVELFPVNLLFALSIAHSLQAKSLE